MELTLNGEIRLKTMELRENRRLFQLILKNRERLAEWMEWVHYIRNEEDLLPLLHMWSYPALINQGYQLGIYDKDELIGMIGVNWINYQTRSSDIAYWLDKDSEGKGIMTLACQALISYLFSTVNLNQIEIRVAPENLKSRAIPERLGFLLAGRIRNAEWINGHYHDHLVFSLAKEKFYKFI